MNARNHSRSGTTLIEVSAVIVVSGIIASCTAVALRNAYQVHTHALRVVAKMRVLDRLRDRVIRDASEAVNVQVGDSLILTMANESRIEYRRENQQIKREKSVAGAIVGRDSWFLVEPFRFSVAVEDSASDENPISCKRISITISLDSSASAVESWTFLARVGVWRKEVGDVR